MQTKRSNSNIKRSKSKTDSKKKQEELLEQRKKKSKKDCLQKFQVV